MTTTQSTKRLPTVQELFLTARLETTESAIRFATCIIEARDREIEELKDLLRSACAIAQRKGKDTAWDRFGASAAKLGVNGITARTYRLLPDDSFDALTASNPAYPVSEDSTEIKTAPSGQGIAEKGRAVDRSDPVG